jgi:hypothetical protein
MKLCVLALALALTNAYRDGSHHRGVRKYLHDKDKNEVRI